jgi:type IV pilus assembly protein PilA
MKKLNVKGFTLIELLAVITIMGILMLVAIPAVSRTIENSRRDTFADVAKEYVNTVRNAVLADELKCGDESVGATGDGTYYFKLDSSDQNTKDIMESGGLSSWSNARVTGYVKWVKTTDTPSGSSEERVKTEYYVYLVDAGKHGIETTGDEYGIKETDISRSKVSTKTSTKAGDTLTYPKVGESDATECTLK